MTDTSIGVSNETKEKLKELKKVPEEYLDSVINRLIEFYEKQKKEVE